MRKLFFIIGLSLSLYSGTLSKSGGSLGVSNMFAQSNVSLGLKVGSASTRTDTYNILGISANYFVLDNLSVGFGYEKWFSGDPDISKISLESSYYIPLDEKIRPYVGAFYRRIMIGDNIGDIDSYGYRAGIAFVQKKLLLSAGIVQEKYETTRGILKDTETYGEMTIGLMF